LGKIAGFGARILNPEDVPKFLNSPQTVLFDKGSLLYGLDQARKAIRAGDQAVIVEGYLDVIALHQGGYANSVSPMGTALTETQLRLLKRFTRRIVLALDPDTAGEKATLRGLEVARQAMDHSQELAFDPRGLLHQEARLQADLRVTTLPQGVDPDEIVNRDPAEWGRILEAARPIVVHVMETLAQGQDLEDAKVKSAIAAQVLPLIGDVPDPVERDAYRQRLARLLRVDERALQSGRGAAARPRRARREEAAAAAAQGKPAAPAGRPSQLLENYILGVLVQQPEKLNLLDRALQQAGLSRFLLQDFDHSDYQAILRLAQAALEQDELDPQHYVQANLLGSLQDLYLELLNAKPEAATPERQLEELVRAVMRLRLAQVKESLNQLHYLQEELQQQGDPLASPYQSLVMQHTKARELLDRALRQPQSGRTP
jgi:DNA primase